jgi:hypothetical protein
VDAATLSAALALAAEVDDGTSIAVRDQAEGDAVLEWARRNFGPHLKNNPPKLSGDAITFKKAGSEVGMLGIAAFAHRFSSTWPIAEMTPLEDEDDEDDGGDGMFPTKPIKGAEVWIAPSGRAYFATMATLVSEEIAAIVEKRERPLRGAGYRHVGDVMSTASDAHGYHGYTKAGGHAWAYFRVAYPSEVMFAVATVMGDGTTVVTTDGETAKEVVANHDARVVEATAAHGSPRAVEPKLRSLAETIESVLASS